jgi:hypothetical protein
VSAVVCPACCGLARGCWLCSSGLVPEERAADFRALQRLRRIVSDQLGEIAHLAFKAEYYHAPEAERQAWRAEAERLLRRVQPAAATARAIALALHEGAHTMTVITPPDTDPEFGNPVGFAAGTEEELLADLFTVSGAHYRHAGGRDSLQMVRYWRVSPAGRPYETTLLWRGLDGTWKATPWRATSYITPEAERIRELPGPTPRGLAVGSGAVAASLAEALRVSARPEEAPDASA